MKYLKYYLTLWVLALLHTAHAQSTQSFTYQPQRPVPGQTIALSYSPAGTPLQGKKNIRGVVYLYNNYQWQTIDLALKPAGNGQFNATLPLAKDCGAAVFKFMAGDSTDNNHDKSYIIMLADPAGSMYNAPGAYAAWGLLRAERFGYGIPGYFKKPQITDTAFYYWMNNEIVRHPQSGALLAVPFVKGIYAYQGQNSLPRINNVIAFLNKQGGEENQLKIRKIYADILHQKASVDSLDALMIKTYPHGSSAALAAYRQVNAERDINKKAALLAQFLADFPLNSANREFNESNFINYGRVYQDLIVLNVMNKNYEILKKYIDALPYDAIIGIFYKVIEIPHKRKDIPDEQLYPYAKMLVNKLETQRNDKPADLWYLSPAEWQQKMEGYFADNVLITYVNLLLNAGHYEDALNYALRAQQTLNYKRAAINNDEVVLLKRAGRTKEMNDVLIKSMYENQSSPEMIDLLKSNYVAQYRSEEGFDKYLESLKNAALSKSTKANLEMINKDMPDWSMYDAAGKLIRFKDLRGKTIVMDFWASWCVPCKASFPGMKLALEKYKNDPDVAFFFVDTEEHDPNYKEQVNKFIKDNNYPFHVLFDNKVEGGKITEEVYNKICKAFTISGVPQKLIIDKNGKLRFITVGYFGSASELADEISTMVELTKKAN